MAELGLDLLQAEIEATQTSAWIGSVQEIGRGVIKVAGLSHAAALGDLVEIETAGGVKTIGEVLQLDANHVTVLSDGAIEALQIGDQVALLGNDDIAPDENWIGRVIDPYGKALDGLPVLRGTTPRSVRGSGTKPMQRRGLGERLETGLTAFNTLLPIVRGQRIGLFAGSGVGKSTLLGKLAMGIESDLVVFAMIGERGRELREFVERILGPKGMERAIVISATSDKSALTRRRCAWVAMTVAEHFRDEGRQVLFVADSITRFAEAHREIALSVGEQNSLRGFPPSTSNVITSLCERSGPGSGPSGDITAVFSVLVAGSDMEEPIADILRGVLDGHVVLDRHIAERGRFPAIDILRSVSRALPHAATAAENALVSTARSRLGTYDRNEIMIQAGLYTKGSDENIDAAIECWNDLDKFVAESESGDIRASFARLASCLEQSLEIGSDQETTD